MLQLRATRMVNADGVPGSILGNIAKVLHKADHRIMNQLLGEMADKDLGELHSALSQGGHGKKTLELASSCLAHIFPEYRSTEKDVEKFRNQQAALQAAWLYLFSRLYMNSNGITSLDTFRQLVENEIDERDKEAQQDAAAAAELEVERATRREVIDNIRQRSWLGRFVAFDES